MDSYNIRMPLICIPKLEMSDITGIQRNAGMHADSLAENNNVQQLNAANQDSIDPNGDVSEENERENRLLFGKYFRITSQERHHVMAECNFCTDSKSFRGSTNNISRFVKHLETIHPKEHRKYLKQLKRREKSTDTLKQSEKELKGSEKTTKELKERRKELKGGEKSTKELQGSEKSTEKLKGSEKSTKKLTESEKSTNEMKRGEKSSKKLKETEKSSNQSKKVKQSSEKSTNQPKNSEKSTEPDDANHTKTPAMRSQTSKKTNRNHEKEAIDPKNPELSKLNSGTCTILFTKYFKLVSAAKTGNMYAECQFCEKPRSMKGRINDGRNFARHLAKFHNAKYLCYKRDVAKEKKSETSTICFSKSVRILLGSFFKLTSRDGSILSVKCNYCEYTGKCEMNRSGKITSHLRNQHFELYVKHQSALGKEILPLKFMLEYFFTNVAMNGENLTAKCKLCKNHQTIVAKERKSANFWQHVKTSHATEFENLSQSMTQKKINKNKKKSDEDTANSVGQTSTTDEILDISSDSDDDIPDDDIMEIFEINSDSERTDALEEPLPGATRADRSNESTGRTNTSDPSATNGMHQVTYMEPLLNNDELSPADSKAAMASYILQQAVPLPSMRYEFEADTTTGRMSCPPQSALNRITPPSYNSTIIGSNRKISINSRSIARMSNETITGISDQSTVQLDAGLGGSTSDIVMSTNNDINRVQRRRLRVTRTASLAPVAPARISQPEFEDALIDLIIDEMVPLSFVESKAFKMFTNLVSTNNPTLNTDTFKFMTTDVIKSRIADMFHENMSTLIQKLTKIEHVATSTNVIMIGNKRFLGMTVHWIEPESFKQESRALCFKRITPPYSSDRLDMIVSFINHRFEIQDKIVGTFTTDLTDFESVFEILGVTLDEEMTECTTGETESSVGAGNSVEAENSVGVENPVGAEISVGVEISVGAEISVDAENSMEAENSSNVTENVSTASAMGSAPTECMSSVAEDTPTATEHVSVSTEGTLAVVPEGTSVETENIPTTAENPSASEGSSITSGTLSPDLEGFSPTAEDIESSDVNMNNDDSASVDETQTQSADSDSPGQERCASQLLHLLLNTDANQAFKNTSYADICRPTIHKLNHLFGLSKRPESIETMKSENVIIKAPVETHWESLCTGIQNVLQYDLESINKVMNAFDAPQFTENEFEFLKEFISVTEPITEALDNLQSNGLYAVLLPTLKTLRDYLESTQNENTLKYCAPLAKAIHSGFMDRFKDFFDVTNEKCISATIAACTHPFFKLRWADSDYMEPDYFDNITEMLISAASKCNTNLGENQSNQGQTSTNPAKKFRYSFANTQPTQQNDSTRSIRMEVISYLNSPASDEENDMTQLNNFTNIRRIFLKFNTMLTSSASAEQLFPFNKICNLQQDQLMCDESIEHLVILHKKHSK